MGLILVSGPLVSPISLEAVKQHLRVEHDDDDEMILSLIDAAVEHFDGADGILGRAIVQQIWELRLDSFPPCLEVPLPPLIGIDSIKYVDVSGDVLTIDPSKYQVVVEGFRKALVVPAYRLIWPVPRDVRDAVTVTFTAGYASVSEDSPIELTSPVPAKLLSAIKLQVELLYGRSVTDAALLQKTIDDLTMPIRIGGFG
jgi:uncharacterized phiE125 gp8 family phage protein